MGKFIDLTGQKFGKLFVIKRDEEKSKKKKRSYWLCKCECGNPNLISVYANHLKTGATSSCGCLKIMDLRGHRYGYLEPIHIDWDKSFCGNSAYWMCKCHLCNSTKLKSVSASSLRKGHSTTCGCKNFSKGEVKIRQILSSMDILFEEQKIFDNCRGKNNVPLRFDFYLEVNNKRFVVEFQGIQHYKIIKGWKGEEGLKERQNRDNKKKQYCLDNGIIFIEIPYWDCEKLSEQYFLNKLNISFADS